MGNDAGLEFPAWLAQRRRNLGFTQAQLAARAGCSTSSIRRVEQGSLSPSPELAVALARALAIPAARHAEFGHFARIAGERRTVDVFGTQSAPDEPRRPRLPPLPAAAADALIGREQALDTAVALLRMSDTRLVTFTGPPGVGKSSLALAAARILEPEFAHGVCQISLDKLSTADQVWPTVAAALGAESSGHAAGAVAEWLRRRNVLLLLDNFEHVLDAAGSLGTILQQAPTCKVLATSRVALRVYGEHEYVVMPLPTAFNAESDSLAAQLFYRRAQRLRMGFAPTPQNRPVVHSLCAEVDGLPLAIEMLAGAMRRATPEQALAQLRSSLLVPEDAMPGGNARQHSLMTTLNWSYGLLPDVAQRVLRVSGIFATGFSRNAMHAVVGVDDSALDQALEELIDHHLLHIQTDPAGDLRFAPLAVVRAFAAQKLKDTGEWAAVGAAHAAWFSLRCATQRSVQSNVISDPIWLAFGAEMPDLQRALDHVLASGDGVRAAAMLVPMLHWAEQRDTTTLLWPVLQRVLGMAPDSADAPVLRSHDAMMNHLHGDGQKALRIATEMVADLNRLADPRDVYELLTTSIAIQRRSGNLNAALTLAEFAMERMTRAGFEHGRILLMRQLAIIELHRGNFARARDLIKIQVAHLHAINDLTELGSALYVEAHCELQLGDYTRARQLAGECLALELSLLSDRSISQTLELLAWISTRDRAPGIAARLLGATQAYRKRVNVHLSQQQQQARADAISRLRQTLGDEAFAVAHRAGELLSEADLLREAQAPA